MTETNIGTCYRCKKLNGRDDNKRCNTCVIQQHQYKNINKEAVDAGKQKYYIENSEVLKAKAKEYRLKNKEAIAASNKIYKLAYNQITIECAICGINIKQCKKSRHDKSKMHQGKLTTTEHIEGIDNNNNK